MALTYRKKLIEVAIPLECINQACANEASPFTPRHPRSLHVWWARRRLAVARAVIFAQMVDDPSSHPELFSTEKAQEKERQRLFRIIEDIVLWENTANKKVFNCAHDEIMKSWRVLVPIIKIILVLKNFSIQKNFLLSTILLLEVELCLLRRSVLGLKVMLVI